MTKALLVTAMRMSRLKNVCLSGNMFECRSGTFTHWATLARFDQRPHKQGKCKYNPQAHHKQVADVATRCCFISFINLWIYLHKVTRISVFEPASRKYAHYFRLLWAVTFYLGGQIFFRKHYQEPPPQTSEEFPASLNPGEENMDWIGRIFVMWRCLITYFCC